MDIKADNWVLVDVDDFQIQRKLHTAPNEECYEMYEIQSVGSYEKMYFCVAHGFIYLEDLDGDERASILGCYDYRSMEEFQKEYPNDWKSKLVGMAFELDAMDCLISAHRFLTWSNARDMIISLSGYTDTELYISSQMESENCYRCQVRGHAVTVLRNPDVETPLSVRDSVLRVDWYNADEGLCGDYDPNNPEDINLLRFDVYKMGAPELWNEMDDGWREVDDASYCTNMPAATDFHVLEQALLYLFGEYRDVIDDYPWSSVKKLGERLSHISPEDFK